MCMHPNDCVYWHSTFLLSWQNRQKKLTSLIFCCMFQSTYCKLPKICHLFAHYLEAKVGRGWLLKYLSGTHGPSLSSLQSLIHMKMTIMTTATASGRTPASLNVYHKKPQVLVSTVSWEASNIFVSGGTGQLHVSSCSQAQCEQQKLCLPR